MQQRPSSNQPDNKLPYPQLQEIPKQYQRHSQNIPELQIPPNQPGYPLRVQIPSQPYGYTNNPNQPMIAKQMANNYLPQQFYTGPRDSPLYSHRNKSDYTPYYPDLPLSYKEPVQPTVGQNDIDPSKSTFFNPQELLSLNDTFKAQKDKNWKVDKTNDRPAEKVSMNSIIANELGVEKELLKDFLKHNGVTVSNIFRVAKIFDKKEENDELQERVVGNQLLVTNASNWIHASFIPTKTKNQLDDLQELLKQSNKYQEACISAGNSKYRDKDFPACISSLNGFGERKDYSDKALANFIWLRPEEFCKSKPIVFDTINPDDIVQGGLGDCYLLAAISSIAAVPNRLERIFLTKKYNAEGIYVIALCINGIWEDVVCDDLFPCKPHNSQPAFNHSKDNKLWVMLIEKAWAKIHGGYLNIAAGLTREALRDLTGASAKTYFVEDSPESLWKMILQGHNRNFIMAAGSDDLNFGSDQFISKIGLAGSHAYSLLGVYELLKSLNGFTIIKYQDRNKIEENKKERIVKLRNPWARGEWKGDWSDKSPKWTPELQKALKVSGKEDGVFCMDYKNFCKYFSDVQVCYFHDGYRYSAIKFQSENNDKTYLKFELVKSGEYYFSVNQKNRRFFPLSIKYRYSPLSQIIGAIDLNKTLQFIGSSTNQDKENWIPKRCEPGVYFVCIYTPWQSIVNECSFSVYGPNTCNINIIKESQLPQRFFEKLLLSHAINDKSKKMDKLSKYEIYYKRWDDKSGLGYLYFENRDKDHVADITVEILKAMNLKVLPPFEGLRPNISLYPNDKKIIAYQPIGYPSSCDIRIVSSWKPYNSKPKAMVENKGTKLIRDYKGKDVGIHLYIVRTKDFIVYQYVNKTKELNLIEKLKFELVDCYLEGTTGNYIDMVVGPGEEKILCIMKNPGAKDFKAKVKYLNYNIKYA